jgi:prolyl-tRNA synthetase
LVSFDLHAEVAREYAAIPVVPGEKTVGEQFAGAVKTFSIEGMMRDGMALQAENLALKGTNFAHAFEVQYLNQAGQQELCRTTS